jgi:hypothetical protein
MEKSIEEKSVTIKTITIDGKKLTKEIFKQIQEDTYCCDGETDGDPWGLVFITLASKFINDEDEKVKAYDTWVVYERDGRLFRSVMPTAAYHEITLQKYKVERLKGLSEKGAEVGEDLRKEQDLLDLLVYEDTETRKIIRELREMPQLFIGA